MLFTLATLIVVVPLALYLIISSEWGQEKIREIGESQLSQLLGTRVEIGKVKYKPFSSITIDSVAVTDDNDSTALRLRQLDARVEILDLILNKKIIVDYANIDGLDLKLYRANKQSPLNIDSIVRRLTRKDPGKPPARFSFRINELTLTDCSMSYDVLDADTLTARFNPNHISVNKLGVKLFAPVVTDSSAHVWMRGLTFTEASGIDLRSLSAEIEAKPSEVSINGFKLQMPRSVVMLGKLLVPIDGYKTLAEVGVKRPIEIEVLDQSHIYLPELAPVLPVMATIDYDIDLALKAAGTIADLSLNTLRLSDTDRNIDLLAHGALKGLPDIENTHFNDFDIELKAHQGIIENLTSKLLSHTRQLPPIASNAINNVGNLSLKGWIEGTLADARLEASVQSALAVAKIEGICKHARGTKSYNVDLAADIDSLRLGALLDNADLNRLSATINVVGEIDAKAYAADIDADVHRFDYKGHIYRDLSAVASIDASSLDVKASINDRYADIMLDVVAKRVDGVYEGSGEIGIARFLPDSLNLHGILPNYDISGNISFDGTGSSINRFNGKLVLDDVDLRRNDGERLLIDNVKVEADNSSRIGHIWLSSDYLDASINGQFDFASIRKAFMSVLGEVLPVAAPPADEYALDTLKCNRFAYDLSFTNPQKLCKFFKLPVTVVDECEIFGNFNELERTALLNIDIPWILQGGKVIRNTTLSYNLDGKAGTSVVYCTSHIPTKKGPMELMATINGQNGKLYTDIDWEILRSIPINGKIKFETDLYKNEEKDLCAKIDFDDSEINFGDDTWTIRPSTILYNKQSITVDNFALTTLTEGITINGIAGKEDDDLLTVDLKNIQLINIFETLEIDNALIGGYATGTVYAYGLLGDTPAISCDELTVKDISYNYCTLGDANVNLSLEENGKLFAFDADIKDPEGEKSFLQGSILIPTEELELNIYAKHVKVGFMKPFMQAFTSDVSGYASGYAHLFGTFKDIDLTGDIKVDDLRIKIDFTNTWYTASDSIHIRPGIIDLKNIRLYDQYGNTAMLNGWVAHEYFHNASFDFTVSDANNLLCYDTNEKLNPIWYGHVFADGKATIKGRPGVVDIGVNMNTSPNSTFTFVLSDQLEADDYSFITFRDATVREEKDPIIYKDTEPEEVRMIERMGEQQEAEIPTAYNMDINMDIDPDAQIVIVMDPIGGDRIKARGEGTMRMRYKSSDNDLRLNGKYTLEQGSYNFTLQDVIIKDFTIKNGSSISFSGDPYSAQLDIEAYYQVNANLSDLDKSFLQDKELNRTNVPVRALLLVTGDMRQPDISFDLEFPTLTVDTYRKVKSIVSTEDMMNKQIIYLLALNRFYTPEYMASTTKGNELFSVASSTISSQLSSMLGKLSENWSIAPNLRSDRGDFSDVEVDVTLSSSLLNNRLLFNGNFGYRDKTLNTNQFIGDFDIEYLLNKQGSWRLKAYNRYNDQNYYLRTAQTTQGVGFVFRHDFDNLFGVFRRKKDKEKIDTIHTIDMLDIQPVDTIIINDTIQVKK